MTVMKIDISDHFSFSKLLKFTFPSVVMMIFTSIYTVVDGLFVSNCVGKTAFSAINLVYPVIFIFASTSYLFGSGGSALVALFMGEGNRKKADELFSFVTFVSFLTNIALAVIGEISLPKIISLLGGSGELYDDALLYGRIFLSGIPLLALQSYFQTFFVTAGKPNLGLFVTVIAGVTNGILDFVFVYVFHWGLTGAAFATVIGMFVGACIPVSYFFNKKNSSSLRFVKFHFMPKELVKVVTNGSSELLSTISNNLVAVLYNYQLLRFYSSDGVAAYGCILYLNFVFISIFIGLSIGSAPIFSYNQGASNYSELQNVFKKLILLMGSLGLIMFLIAFSIASPFARFFVGYDETLFTLTVYGSRIYAFLYIFAGVNIFGSALFTSLNNGLVSAFLAFLRCCVFQVIFVLTLPLFFGGKGVWFSSPLAEAVMFVITIVFIFSYQRRYGYTKYGFKHLKDKV